MHDVTINFGCGQNTKLGWKGGGRGGDPASLPRKTWRSLQPGEQGKSLFTMCFCPCPVSRIIINQKAWRGEIHDYLKTENGELTFP